MQKTGLTSKGSLFWWKTREAASYLLKEFFKGLWGIFKYPIAFVVVIVAFPFIALYFCVTALIKLFCPRPRKIEPGDTGIKLETQDITKARVIRSDARKFSQKEAFLMGEHDRLGAGSAIHLLRDPSVGDTKNINKMIFDMAFDDQVNCYSYDGQHRDYDGIMNRASYGVEPHEFKSVRDIAAIRNDVNKTRTQKLAAVSKIIDEEESQSNRVTL